MSSDGARPRFDLGQGWNARRFQGMAVFTGAAHPDLAAEICRYLNLPLSPAETQHFANTCIEVQLQANCRERDVFIIQPLVPPVHENLMELLLMLDAARGASAGRTTAVIPHYAYARSDKKDAPRISIGGKLVADLLVTAGADRVLTMTLHAPQVHGFFDVPVDHLNALYELATHFRRGDLADTVVVAPDLGNAKAAAAFGRMLGVPIAAANKQRVSDEEVSIASFVGSVADRHVILLDDEIARGSTIMEVLEFMEPERIRSARVACTHGLFTDDAIDRISGHSDVVEIVCTNTVPIPDHKRGPKLTVLSIAPQLAEAMRRIHIGESVSALFDQPDASMLRLFEDAGSISSAAPGG